MPEYFTTPFPFHRIIQRSGSIPKVDLETSIRNHLSSLVLMRLGEFAYDRTMGFEIWDYDKEVFYHNKAPYFEGKQTRRGLMETNEHARKHFKENLHALIIKHEIRLNVSTVQFGFEKVMGNLSVYQRKIIIEVQGKIKSTGKVLSPPFRMKILYTPFQVETS